MSFRLFVYYCALCGGWAGLLGWMLGYWILAPTPTTPGGGGDLIRTGLRGMSLGLTVALGLSLVDSFWVFGLKKIGPVAARVGAAIFVGAVGGLLGGIVGQWLFQLSGSVIFYVIGWTLTGTLIGISIGTFDILLSIIKERDVINSRRKLLKCLIGGAVGGMIGGTLSLLIRRAFDSAVLSWLFKEKDPYQLWTPAAVGFVVLGACIGLLVSLAQIILKEAWIKVEAGFRPGREMILAKESTSIGRAESADIALFGDAGVERIHANIVQRNGQYVLVDDNTPGGTYVNDVKVAGPTPLRSGDLIRMGSKSLLRFYEKPKKK